MFKLKKAAALLAMVLAGAGVAVVSTPSAALAGTSGTRISRAGAPVFMEVWGWSTTPGTILDQWGPNSGTDSKWDTGANQEWSLPRNGPTGGIDGADGYIQNMYSHMCIETDGRQGDPIYQAPCNGGVYQEWNLQGYYYFDWFNFEEAYYFHIVNPLSQLALNASGGSYANGTRIIGWPLTGQNTDDNEAWGIFL